MRKKIEYILSTSTFRQSLLATTTTVVTGGLGLAFYALLARYLGASLYGIVTLTLSVLTLVSDIGNIGSDTGLLSFIGKYSHNREKRNSFLTLALIIKCISLIILSLFGLLFSHSVSHFVFHKPFLEPYIFVAFLSAGCVLLYSFVTTSLQGLERYGKWSVVSILSNLLRIILLFLFLTFGLTAWIGIISYVLPLLFCFILGIIFLPKFFRKFDSSITKEFFTYNIWVTVFTIIAAISSKIDVFLTGRYLSLEIVGIYSVALGLSSIVPQFILGIATVVAPKLSRFTDDFSAIQYLKKLQLFVTLLAVVGVVFGLIVSYFGIPLIYGTEYVQSFVPFAILLFAQAIFLISLPAHSTVFYYFRVPKVFLWVSSGHLLIMIVLGTVLIPYYGATGAAVTYLMGTLWNFLIPAFWVMYKFFAENRL